MAAKKFSDALERFTGLAKTYAQFRPSYSPDAVDFIIRHCQLSPSSLLVDVGCGTGISSRVFAARGISVLGLDPNGDMLAAARREPWVGPGMPPRFQFGQAESTGLDSDSVDAVLAAQCFHWFQQEQALKEFHRILKPGGWVIIMGNERDRSDPFTAHYGEVIRSAPEAKAIETLRAEVGKALLNCPLFQSAQSQIFPNSQKVDEEGLVGRAFSASYAPREERAALEFAKALKSVFRQYEKDAAVTIRYELTIYLAQKPKGV